MHQNYYPIHILDNSLILNIGKLELFLKVFDDSTVIQILCFRTIYIVLFSSKTHNISETGNRD
jgi:hypothetical protein